MRGKTHSERLDVRLHPDLKRQLIELARERRMTPAEAVREALRSIVLSEEGAAA